MLIRDRVVSATGAVAGPGRAHALWLAQRGARVVVNNRIHARRPRDARPVDAITSAGPASIAGDSDALAEPRDSAQATIGLVPELGDGGT